VSLDTSPSAQLEIGHVLFIDVVGYSKLLSNEQRGLFHKLNEIVRSTEQFRSAEAAQKLVRLPTGDGMALAFFSSPDAPLRCAMSVAKSVRQHPELQLRMGVHSGPVDVVFDVNDRPNVTGAGINMAQRVMDCGDAGHILLSKRSADDLAQYAEWKEQLHDLGEMEVKHGAKIRVTSFYNQLLGNPESPQKFRLAEQNRRAAVSAGKRRNRRRLIVAVAGVTFLIAAIVSGTWAWHRRAALTSAYQASMAPLLEKSIAVLPFENFDQNKENAYFADGVQDDILTDLAKVSDLKVISRRSVAQYRGSNQSIRQIGQALQVAYVLEGTVRRAGGKIRITAQLIDTRTEVEKWAEKFERDVADLFTIQNQISETIVAQLKANLSPAEKAAIETAPTHDLQAYDLYLRARALLYTYGLIVKVLEDNRPKAEKLLEEAIARDPKFVLAYCVLAEVQATPVFAQNATPEQLVKARATLDTALKLAPESGEVHLALANYYNALVWWHSMGVNLSSDSVGNNKARTIEEMTIAERKLPNSVDVLDALAQLAQDRGQWKDALTRLRKATQLDPRNPDIAQHLIELYYIFRWFPEADSLIERTLASLSPDATGALWRRKGIFARAQGNLTAAMAAFDAHPKRHIGLAGLNFEIAQVLLYEHKFNEARQLIETASDIAAKNNLGPSNPFFDGHKSLVLGVIDRAEKQVDKAHTDFERGRDHFSEWLKRRPNEPMALAFRAVCIAGLGDKETALRESRQVVELWPLSREPITGADVAIQNAVVQDWTGDREAAIHQLETLAKLPGPLAPGDLRFNPQWDDLRSHPRFDKIIAEAAKPVKID